MLHLISPSSQSELPALDEAGGTYALIFIHSDSASSDMPVLTIPIISPSANNSYLAECKISEFADCANQRLRDLIK